MRTERGMTLVEVMIATLIMGFIMTSIMMALMQGSGQVAAELPRDELEMAMQAALDKVEEILRDAKVSINPADEPWDGSWIDFQVPVDVDNDGDAFAKLNPLTIDWGVIHGVGRGQRLGGTEWGRRVSAATGTIRFVPRPDGVSLSEPAQRVNINANTETARDTDDVFELGNLVFSSDDNGDNLEDWSMNLGGGWILQPYRNWGGDIDDDGRLGDIDGDGVKQPADPIFWQDSVDGEGRPGGDGRPDAFDDTCPHLMVTLWVGRAPLGVPPIFMGRTVRIFLRNQHLD